MIPTKEAQMVKIIKENVQQIDDLFGHINAIEKRLSQIEVKIKEVLKRQVKSSG